jgi:hypothetical protein
MKAKSVRSAQPTIDDKFEILEQDFKYTLLTIAQKYELLAESNMQTLTKIRMLENLGYRITYYQSKKGELSYEAKIPEKIGF